MIENRTEQFIKELYGIELILMEAQKKVFEKRLKLLTEIQDVQKKKNSQTQVPLTNFDKYIPSLPNGVSKKRTEIIDLEYSVPKKIQQKTGLNKSRNNQINQQEASINESEIQYLEQVNRELEEQNSEIEIEVDVPCQIQKLMNTGKYQMKKRRKDEETNCPVCGKLFSSRAGVKRHIKVFHRIEQNGGLVSI